MTTISPSPSSDKLIVKIDSTVIRDSSCFLRLFLKAIHGYKESPLKADIVYGQAVHRFVELAEKGMDSSLAIAKSNRFYRETPKKLSSKKEWLNEAHLVKTLCQFSDRLLEGKDDLETIKVDNNSLSEKKFAIPLYEEELFGIMLCGTIDSICKKRNGIVLVRDYKTTSSWNVNNYFEDFKASPQLKTYIWALKWHAKMYPNSIFGELAKHEIGGVIDGIFLSASKETEFIRSEVFLYNETQMTEYEHLLMFLVERLKTWIRVYLDDPTVYPACEGTFNGACKTPYGKCSFFHACTSSNKEIFQAVLDQYFTKKSYDPLHF